MPSLSELERKQRRTMHLLRDYVDMLPVTAAVAEAVQKVPDEGNQLPDELEKLAAVDPTLAIRMLYLANHTFLGAHGLAVTLGGVMARAGAARISEGLAHLGKVPALDPTGSEVRELWVHSIQVAALARVLAMRMPQLGLNADEAYLAGLVHDLGRFVMLVAAPARYGSVADREWRNGDELLAAETEVCGFTHTTLGWLACRAWNFPDQLAAVNRGHHEWTTLGEAAYQPHSLALVHVVGLADDLAFAWENETRSQERVTQILRSGEAFLGKAHGRSPAPVDPEVVFAPLLGASDAATRLFAGSPPS